MDLLFAIDDTSQKIIFDTFTSFRFAGCTTVKMKHLYVKKNQFQLNNILQKKLQIIVS